jgi:steroid delta-isomerase-like uncharacterized protein
MGGLVVGAAVQLPNQLVILLLGWQLNCHPNVRYFVGLFGNDGNLDLVDELYAPDFVWHVVDMGEDIVGTSAFKELVTSFRTAFPDFNVTFDEVFAAGDTTVIQWTMTGTNTGPFGDLPPTGQPVTLHGVAISRAVDGMTVEVWQHYNQLFMFQQMGFTLTPP